MDEKQAAERILERQKEIEDRTRATPSRTALMLMSGADAPLVSRWALDLEQEVKRLGRVRDEANNLADFIMREIPGEPSGAEGAVECAVRLLRSIRAGEGEEDSRVKRPRNLEEASYALNDGAPPIGTSAGVLRDVVFSILSLLVDKVEALEHRVDVLTVEARKLPRPRDPRMQEW